MDDEQRADWNHAIERARRRLAVWELENIRDGIDPCPGSTICNYHRLVAADDEIKRLRAEVETLREELAVNAHVLAMQCDKAAEAELERDEAQRALLQQEATDDSA